MGLSWIPLVAVTGFWAIIGVVLPFFVPKSEHRGITQSCLMLTAAVCWMFWIYCYMAQMNPLIGPEMKIDNMMLVKHYWGDF